MANEKIVTAELLNANNQNIKTYIDNHSGTSGYVKKNESEPQTIYNDSGNNIVNYKSVYTEHDCVNKYYLGSALLGGLGCDSTFKPVFYDPSTSTNKYIALVDNLPAKSYSDWQYYTINNTFRKVGSFSVSAGYHIISVQANYNNAPISKVGLSEYSNNTSDLGYYDNDAHYGHSPVFTIAKYFSSQRTLYVWIQDSTTSTQYNSYAVTDIKIM